MPHSKPVALVTGANRGLGREVARQLAAGGHTVILTARDADSARIAADELGRDKLDVRWHSLDVNDDESAREAAAWVAERFGRLDALVNNAGILPEAEDAGIFDVPDQALIDAFTTNALGPFRVTRAFSALLRQNPRACVVNVSSGMGSVSEMGPGYPAYRASKSALNALTRVLAHELGPAGVKVNAVCPGWVRTAMGGPRAPRTHQQGAAGIVWAATLPQDGPSSGFFRDGKPIAW
jgi:NAD(P)-dependent dehydrogenase (short-subunit alcohol dehydrogenase family)